MGTLAKRCRSSKTATAVAVRKQNKTDFECSSLSRSIDAQESKALSLRDSHPQILHSNLVAASESPLVDFAQTHHFDAVIVTGTILQTGPLIYNVSIIVSNVGGENLGTRAKHIQRRKTP